MGIKEERRDVCVRVCLCMLPFTLGGVQRREKLCVVFLLHLPKFLLFDIGEEGLVVLGNNVKHGYHKGNGVRKTLQEPKRK